MCLLGSTYSCAQHARSGAILECETMQRPGVCSCRNSPFSEGGRVVAGFSPLFLRRFPNYNEALFSLPVDVDSKSLYINSQGCM